MTKIEAHQLESATYCARLANGKPPVICTEAGSISVISTNRALASRVTWPAAVESPSACSVPLDRLRRVRTIRGLLSLLAKNAGAKPSFGHEYLQKLASIPPRAEAVLSCHVVEQVGDYLRDLWIGSGIVGIDADGGRLLIAGKSFSATISKWREREPVNFAWGLLYELFTSTFSPTITLTLKRDGSVCLLHIHGEQDGVFEDHFLASLR